MNLEQSLSNNLLADNSRKEWLDRFAARALVLARIAWPIYVALLMSLFVAALQVRYIDLTNLSPGLLASLRELGLSTGFYAFYFLAFEIFFASGFIVVAAIIYARNSDDWIGVFTAYTLVTFGLCASPIIVTLNALEEASPLWALPVRFLSFAGWSMLILFFYLFPDGRFIPSQTRLFVILSILVVQVPWTIFKEAPFSPWQWPPALHIAALLVTWLPAWFAQFLRYRLNTDKIKAQQTKWFVYGSILAMISAFGFHIPYVLNPALNDNTIPASLMFHFWSAGTVTVCVLLMPIGIGVSILRYKLWDIDLLINKTLVYIPLTGILAGLYAASIRIFQEFFQGLLGTSSDLSVVMTTLVLASTFTPIKNALQNAVDRRFKGPPDPSEALQDLVGEMRLYVEMNDPVAITRRVMEDLVRSFQATGGAVYMQRHDQLELVSTHGQWNEAAPAMSAPIGCNAYEFGLIKLNARADSEPYTEQNEKTLQEVVGLLGCTLQVGRIEVRSEK